MDDATGLRIRKEISSRNLEDTLNELDENCVSSGSRKEISRLLNLASEVIPEVQRDAIYLVHTVFSKSPLSLNYIKAQERTEAKKILLRLKDAFSQDDDMKNLEDNLEHMKLQPPPFEVWFRELIIGTSLIPEFLSMFEKLIVFQWEARPSRHKIRMFGELPEDEFWKILKTEWAKLKKLPMYIEDYVRNAVQYFGDRNPIRP